MKISLIELLIILLMSFIPFVSYYSSCKKADIYNIKNGTTYSCSDFFWAESQINSQTQTINLE